MHDSPGTLKRSFSAAGIRRTNRLSQSDVHTDRHTDRHGVMSADACIECNEAFECHRDQWRWNAFLLLPLWLLLLLPIYDSLMYQFSASDSNRAPPILSFIYFVLRLECEHQKMLGNICLKAMAPGCFIIQPKEIRHFWGESPIPAFE